MTPVPEQRQSLLEALGASGVVAVVGALFAVLLTAYCTAMAKRSAERSVRYSVMVATLTSWAEMPYRVRRRLSDDPAVAQPLMDRFHDLQEQLALDGAQLAAECPWLFKRHVLAVRTVRDAVRPFIVEAWDGPAGGVDAMNLKGWGPTGCTQAIEAFQAELRYRFGWRRALNPVRLLWQGLRGPARGRGRPLKAEETLGSRSDHPDERADESADETGSSG